ncbi:hypothetical protein [Streptomyces sp. NPDC058424]|uniref:hypothetical protein n=1 Tax=Streptomyces sp. NPDC058424 TaxID=3346491 RepID=UPI003651EF57
MVTAGPASANAACGKAGVYNDGTTVRTKAGVSANLRSGSNTSCGITGWADNQDSRGERRREGRRRPGRDGAVALTPERRR